MKSCSPCELQLFLICVESGFHLFIIGQTRSHNPQFTHCSVATLGYQKPSLSEIIWMQFLGQALAHA